MTHTVIVDGNNLAMRSFHAAQHSMSAAGEDTGALVLFINSLAMHVRAEKPDRLVVCWDSGRSQYRERLYPQYKAARHSRDPDEPEPQAELFSIIKRFLKLANIRQWAMSGVEADDLIAAAWRHHHLTDSVVILSSDKDLLQLLDQHTEQIRFSSRETATNRWTYQRFVAEYGYTPTQLPLVMALMGDPSDGVPGIKGIGPKRALKMLQAADWDLDKALVPFTPEQRDLATTSLALVDLGFLPVEVPEVPPFAPVKIGDMTWPNLIGFCEHYELRLIRARLVGGDLWY